MKYYEGIFILDPRMGGSQLKNAVGEVQNTITKEGGTVERTDEWGKRRTAYMVRKQHEGYYVLVHFTLSPEKMERVRGLYQLNESIFKHMILSRDPNQPPKPEAKPKAEADREEESPAEAAKQQEE